MNVTCDECFFFEAIVKEQTGLCRRYPPVNVAGADPQWVEVNNTDWCGEFKDKTVFGIRKVDQSIINVILGEKAR